MTDSRCDPNRTTVISERGDARSCRRSFAKSVNGRLPQLGTCVPYVVMWGEGRWARPLPGKSRGDGGRLELSAFTCFSLSSLSERAAGKQLRENGYVSYFGGPAYSGVPWLCVPLSREVCPYRCFRPEDLLTFRRKSMATAICGQLQPICNRGATVGHRPLTVSSLSFTQAQVRTQARHDVSPWARAAEGATDDNAFATRSNHGSGAVGGPWGAW